MPEGQAPFLPDHRGQRDERLHQFAHALKNRMAGIWQAAALLHAAPEGAERDMLLAMAEKNYFNGARELEQLLDDFGVERGIGKLHTEKAFLAPILERSIGHVAFRTEKKNQPVDLRVEDTPPVIADVQVMEQLFEALLSNASKYSPKGAPIEVRLWADGRMAAVDVRDHGAGLSEADLRDLFTRYALLSTRSTDGESQARSTLARARHWAEAHGGTLHACSAGPGQGAVFSARFPLA